MTDSFINKLKVSFKGEVMYDGISREKYSRDASLFKIKPEVVLFPKDVSDVQAIVKAIQEERAQGNKEIYLTPRSAGTDMTGGPLGTSVIIEFTKYFNIIKKVTPEFAITEPGVYYRDFDKATLEKGVIMPAYTASRELCTIGGMVANNSGGEKTLQYGKTQDYVTNLKMVMRDGNEYEFKPLTLAELEEKKKLQTLEGDIYRKTHELIEKNYDLIAKANPHLKNSSGYYLWDVLNKEKGTFDLTKLIVGSQGTFGLITEATLRLVKPKTHSRMLVVFMKSMKGLGDLTNHILAFKPESLESYDDHTFKFAAKVFPLMIKQLKGNLITLAIRFIPEFWAIITGGVPKLVLLAEFTGDSDEEAYQQALKAQASLKEFNVRSKVTTSDAEVKKYWTIRRESFSMLRKHVKHLRTAPFIDDFVVIPENLPDFLPKLYAILDEYKDITYTVAGHVGNGNFHIIPLMDMSKPKAKKDISDLMERVNNLILEYKGSITGEHNDGIIRTPYVEKMFGPEMYKLFVETKHIFDPENVFNPGKKVNGDWKYAVDHFDTTPL